MRFLEDDLQMAVFEYLSFLPVYAFHVKNSGAKNIKQAVRDKKLGIKAGVADVVLICQDGITRFIELKAAKGKLSENQIKFRDMCLSVGVPWALCRSVEEVQETLKFWGVIA